MHAPSNEQRLGQLHAKYFKIQIYIQYNCTSDTANENKFEYGIFQ